MRLHLQTVIGQRGSRMGQLQHGEAVVALADTQRDGFARVPFLLLWPFVITTLPFGRRQNTARFAKNVDAGQLTKAEWQHLRVHHVDAHVIGQKVIVGVTGLNDGAVHVHQAVPPFLVVPKTMVSEHEIARI